MLIKFQNVYGISQSKKRDENEKKTASTNKTKYKCIYEESLKRAVCVLRKKETFLCDVVFIGYDKKAYYATE